MVPKALKTWFIIHFIVDIVVALPLFLYPELVLAYFGWEQIDPITTRLFAAALFAIGIESFLGRNATYETYNNMLNIKIIWSFFALLAFALAISQGLHNLLVWLGLLVFLIFNLIWSYWKWYLYKKQ